MDTKELLSLWKESNSGLSFGDWKESRREELEKEKEITPQQENREDISGLSKSQIAFSSELNKWVKRKTWKDWKVRKHIYLSKKNYERLKNESISDKVNRILTDYFYKLDNGELTDEVEDGK